MLDTLKKQLLFLWPCVKTPNGQRPPAVTNIGKPALDVQSFCASDEKPESHAVALGNPIFFTSEADLHVCAP